MKNAVILHGTNGNPEENWFPWLKHELEKINYKVWLPQLPNCDKPNVDTYNKFLISNWEFNDETVLIGHSSGAVEILSLLENLPEGILINKAILVAGFVDNLNWDALDELFIHPFEWEKIKSKSKRIILIHSDNDPYVPLEHGKILQKNLNAELLIKEGQKHFSVKSFGEEYRKFPLLVELIS